MYQTLICRILGGDGVRNHARSLSAAFDSELFQRPANALIDRVGANAEADRNFFAAVVAVDQQKAFNLALAETSNSGSGVVILAPLFNAI
jgi:hypothetical protein